MDFIYFDSTSIYIPVMGNIVSEFHYSFNEDTLNIINQSVNTYNIVDYNHPVSHLKVIYYAKDSMQFIPLNEGANELFSEFTNLTFYNPISVDRYTYYIENDSVCKNEINRAKRMVANDSLVLHLYTERWRFRQEKELIELLNNYGITFENLGLAPDHDVDRNCFHETMDYYVYKKYGRSFVDSLLTIADTLMLKNNLSNFINSDFCDEVPYAPISKDWYDMTLDVKIPI